MIQKLEIHPETIIHPYEGILTTQQEPKNEGNVLFRAQKLLPGVGLVEFTLNHTPGGEWGKSNERVLYYSGKELRSIEWDMRQTLEDTAKKILVQLGRLRTNAANHRTSIFSFPEIRSGQTPHVLQTSRGWIDTRDGSTYRQMLVLGEQQVLDAIQFTQVLTPTNN